MSKLTYREWADLLGCSVGSAWQYHNGGLGKNSPLKEKFRAALEQIERERQQQAADALTKTRREVIGAAVLNNQGVTR